MTQFNTASRISGGRKHEPKWLVLREKDEAKFSYYRALGFSIIVGDTEALLDFLEEAVSNIAEPEAISVGRETSQLFPSEAIPDPRSQAIRPIAEFYRGAEPNWNDVLSGRIPTTSHYDNLIDKINSGVNLLLLGTPACGKTTLLMQAATGVKASGHVLVSSLISKEKAELISRKLEREKAIVFLDDYTSSLQALKVFSCHSNIQVVATDQEYYFDLSSHLLDLQGFEIMYVTDLSDSDIQGVFSHIPPKIRRNKLRRPKMAANMPPSIFEVVEDNTTYASLRERFREVLRDLKEEDQAACDLLIMCCYVKWCRTAVSLDMAHAFLRSEVKGISESLQVIDFLGSLLGDYSGELVDTSQDHFVPRSGLVATAVLFQAAPLDLKRVLMRFHQNVSPLRICAFDTFRRKAFDADLIKRAFSDWQEGFEFYDSVFQRDQSPFQRQQGALYLSRKHRFTEAFLWVDEALEMTRRRVPSIRNTHAGIMFDANISRNPSDPDVKSMLQQSMQILTDCHESDMRKVYHVKKYSEQACNYWDVVGGKEGKDYLHTALEWLEKELNSMPKHRRMRMLLRDVKQRLG